jgi:8-oxo-dGTP pyrophosphatase MutT (NUDIX family)
MTEVKSCGVIVFRREPVLEFLLMKHPTRWDLPKGHLDPGESEVGCALRELREETGIDAQNIELDATYRYVTQYQVHDRRHPGEKVLKTLVIFLGWLRADVPIQVSEHGGYRWFRWQPPHQIQLVAIDPLLRDVARHLSATD